MNDSFAKTCTEVTKFLETIPKNKIKKIPMNVILYYKDNMDRNYKFKIDNTKNMYEQKFTKKAAIIIIAIYKKYLANEEEKIKLNEILKKNTIIIEEKREEYNPDNIFKNKKGKTDIEKINLPVEIKKETFFNRLISFMKGLFNKTN